VSTIALDECVLISRIFEAPPSGQARLIPEDMRLKAARHNIEYEYSLKFSWPKCESTPTRRAPLKKKGTAPRSRPCP